MSAGKPGIGAWPSLVLSALCCASCSAAVFLVPEDSPYPRIDFRTVIIRPAAQGPSVRVTVFCAFRRPAEAPPPREVQLVLPVDGTPEATRAQAMTRDGFDRVYTHADDVEGAFYRKVLEERKARLCLYTTIAATGGVPAWCLLAPRWPPSGPALTAVAPAGAPTDVKLPAVLSVKVLRARDFLKDMPTATDPRARRALRRFAGGHVIVVGLIPAASSPRELAQPAVSGVRISYEIASLGRDATFRFPLPGRAGGDPPALTRIYVVSPWDRRAEIAGLPASSPGRLPQKIVNDALSAFGYSPQFRRQTAKEVSALHASSVRNGNGGETTRVVAAFHEVAGEINVAVRWTSSGALRVTLLAAGAVLYGILWPLTAAIYLAGVWVVFRAYFWLTSRQRPGSAMQKYAMLAGLGPFLTPWFMLKWACGKDGTADDGDRSGALGALSPRAYDCVARLVLWAGFVCVSWAVVAAVGGLARWLRFG